MQMLALTYSTCLVLSLSVAPSLVEHLGSRSYRERDHASIALATFGPLAYPALETAAGGHPDPEVRQRAKQLRPDWVEEVADAKSRRLGALPWLDAAVVGAGPYQHYLNEAEQGDVPAGTTDAHYCYREATRLWARAMIIQGKHRAWILERVRWMQELEDEYHRWAASLR